MARRRRHARAPAELRGSAIRRLLSAMLARLPRTATGWLSLSSPAWLHRVAAALLRLLGGPAHAGPQVPSGKAGRQGGDAGEGFCPADAVPDSAPAVIQAVPKTEVDEACAAAAAKKTHTSVCDAAAAKKTHTSVCDAAGAKNTHTSVCDATDAKNTHTSVCDATNAKNTHTSVWDADAKNTHSSERLQQGSSSPQWEPVKNRKGKWKHVVSSAPPQPEIKVKQCTYCKRDGHLAKDCPGWNNVVTGCDRIGKECPTRTKHKEETFNLDQLFAEDEMEEDADNKAHRMYRSRISGCRNGFILCLACYLKGKECVVLEKDEAMKSHLLNIHGTEGFLCVKKGCLARAETKRDVGLHHYICHKI